MSRQTVKPEQIKSLKDWVARWPKATNLGFDPETREPTIYSAGPDRTRVSSIPWKREADTLSVLQQPSRFPPAAVEAATRRYTRIQEQRAKLRIAGEESLRLAEAAVLEAWRQYRAAPATTRSTLRRDILSAEETLYNLQESLANKSRTIMSVQDPDERDVLLTTKVGIYIPPMPLARRGISLVAGATEGPEPTEAPAKAPPAKAPSESKEEAPSESKEEAPSA
jgi:hypothetical protein